MRPVLRHKLTSLATQASIITLVNNKGDVAKTLDDLASSETVRATLTATLTAGALEYINTTVMPDVFKNLSIEDAKSLQGRLVNGAFEGTTSALVNTAINGGSLSDNLEAALLNSSVNAAHGFAASEIKAFENQYVLHKVLHAAAGCVAAEAKRAECEAGAISVGVGEMVAELFTPKNGYYYTDEEENIKLYGKFIAGTIAAYSGYDANTAIGSAEVAIKNNSLVKLVSFTGKTLAKTYERYKALKKAGKNVTKDDLIKSLKNQGADELIGIAGDILTIFNGQSSGVDRFIAAIDLVVGTNYNTKGDKAVATKVSEMAKDFSHYKDFTYTKHIIESADLTKLSYDDVISIFNNISPSEFKVLWQNPQNRQKISNLLRKPGGYHEWFMVSRADKFQSWGVSVEQICYLELKQRI